MFHHRGAARRISAALLDHVEGAALRLAKPRSVPGMNINEPRYDF